MKNVLVISSSLRKNSNSDSLAKEFARGAEESGNKVDFVSLFEKRIEFCRGCLVCQKTQRCVINDDADEIREKMLKADIIVFATPIYYYEMSGQLKTLLDRMNPLYSSDYAFCNIYVLTTAAEDEAHVPERAISGVQGWIDCFKKAQLAGTLFCGGVNDPGDITDNAALHKAYEMGKHI